MWKLKKGRIVQTFELHVAHACCTRTRMKQFEFVVPAIRYAVEVSGKNKSDVAGEVGMSRSALSRFLDGAP